MKTKGDENAARKEWYRNRLRQLYFDLKESQDPELPTILQNIEEGFYRRFDLTKDAPNAEETAPYLIH